MLAEVYYHPSKTILKKTVILACATLHSYKHQHNYTAWPNTIITKEYWIFKNKCVT